MKTPFPFGRWVAAFALAGAVAAPAQLAAPVKMSELPAAVREAVKQQAGSGRVVNIEKSAAGREPAYDVGIRREGHLRTVSFAADGRVVEKEVFMEELRPALRTAIKEQTGTNAIESISQQFDGPKTSYEVEANAGKHTRSLTFDDAGKLVEKQVFLEELTPTVRAAAIKEAGVGAPGDILEEFEEGEHTFQVEINPGEHASVVTLDPAGEVKTRQSVTSLSATPAAVQKAVERLAGTHEAPATVTKTEEDGEITYEIEYRENGAWKKAVFDTEGQPAE